MPESIQNVIVEKQQGNSDSKSTAQVTGNNTQKSSNEVIRTSLPKMKYNFRNHNNINYRSKYAGHIDGTNNKKNKNSSQRKIGEERKCTDQGKCSLSIVPPPYVPVQKSKSFLTSKRPPASTVSSPYLRETKKTIPAPKISAVPQSYLRAVDSNKNSLPISFKDTTIHEPNIPITIDTILPQQKYFSLFHTVASRTIPVETISSKKHSTNTVKIVASNNTVTDDPT